MSDWVEDPGPPPVACDLRPHPTVTRLGSDWSDWTHRPRAGCSHPPRCCPPNPRRRSPGCREGRPYVYRSGTSYGYWSATGLYICSGKLVRRKTNKFYEVSCKTSHSQQKAKPELTVWRLGRGRGGWGRNEQILMKVEFFIWTSTGFMWPLATSTTMTLLWPYSTWYPLTPISPPLPIPFIMNSTVCTAVMERCSYTSEKANSIVIQYKIL